MNPTDRASLFLGCMLFGRWGIREQGEVDRIVAQAIDLGYNGFDTASSYGEGDSESMLGRALLGRQERPVICTKFGAGTAAARVGHSRAELTAALDASLRRLDVDHVDIMMIHRVDDGTPIDDFLDVLAGAMDAGKIGAIGSSSMAGDLLLELHLAAGERGLHIECDQFKYSMIDRSAEVTHLPVTRRCGITPMFYGVLDEGLLAGSERQAPGRGLGRPAMAVEVHPWPAAAQRSLELRQDAAAKLRDLARAHGRSLLDLAIAFAASVPAGDRRPALVVGVGSLDQMAAVAASTQDLDAELRHQIDEIVVPGTSIGIPDRSRMRADVLRATKAAETPLTVGDPRAGGRPGDVDRSQPPAD